MNERELRAGRQFAGTREPIHAQGSMRRMFTNFTDDLGKADSATGRGIFSARWSISHCVKSRKLVHPKLLPNLELLIFAPLCTRANF
jgi:hypothetical protein